MAAPYLPLRETSAPPSRPVLSRAPRRVDPVPNRGGRRRFRIRMAPRFAGYRALKPLLEAEVGRRRRRAVFDHDHDVRVERHALRRAAEWLSVHVHRERAPGVHCFAEQMTRVQRRAPHLEKVAERVAVRGRRFDVDHAAGVVRVQRNARRHRPGHRHRWWPERHHQYHRRVATSTRPAVIPWQPRHRPRRHILEAGGPLRVSDVY